MGERSETIAPAALWRALALHVLLLPIWAFWALLSAASSPSESPLWPFLISGAIWIGVAALLIMWWREGRQHLPSRVIVWALAWWVALLIVPLFFRGFRRGFVPPPLSSYGGAG